MSMQIQVTREQAVTKHAYKTQQAHFQYRCNGIKIRSAMVTWRLDGKSGGDGAVVRDVGNDGGDKAAVEWMVIRNAEKR